MVGSLSALLDAIRSGSHTIVNVVLNRWDRSSTGQKGINSMPKKSSECPYQGRVWLRYCIRGTGQYGELNCHVQRIGCGQLRDAFSVTDPQTRKATLCFKVSTTGNDQEQFKDFMFLQENREKIRHANLPRAYFLLQEQIWHEGKCPYSL